MKTREEILVETSGVEKEAYVPYEHNDVDLTDYDPQKPTILFADDSSGIVVLFKRLVRRLNLKDYFNVINVSGDDACIKIIDTLRMRDDVKIDIAILDITFGGAVLYQGRNRMMDGIEIASIFKQLDQDMPILFLTGHIISEKVTPTFIKKIEKVMEGEYNAYVVYKDQAISQNYDLIKQLLENSKYENYIPKIFSTQET